jgi:transporter family-2 protein
MLAAVSASAVAVFLSLVAGLAGSIQVAVSGTFGRRIGVLEAAAFGAIFAALILVALVALASRSLGGIAAGLGEPPWLWLNGVMSAIVVAGITYAGPRIGTFATIALVIAAQLFMAVLIDAFGMFGLERIPINWARISGLVLLAAGAALVLKR